MGKPKKSNVFLPERELTQGIETSKYLVEKKSNEIPSVAASEMGKAQTELFIVRGCRTQLKYLDL